MAQGQATTSTATPRASAKSSAPSASSQAAVVRTATAMTAGTKTPATRSAVRWMGIFSVCAFRTAAVIRDTVLSAAGTRHFDLGGPGEVHRPRHDRVGDRPFDRHALPGQEGLVHRRAAPHDPSVERHALSGAHANVLGPAHFLHRHEALDAVPHHARPVGGKGQQLGQGVGGAAPGAVFEPAAEPDDGDDERGGIEEQHARAARRERHDRGDVGGARAQPDQAVHAERPVAERGPERFDEGPAEEQANGSRQRELRVAPRDGGPEAAHRHRHRRAGEREGPEDGEEPVPPTGGGGRLRGLRRGGRRGRLDAIGAGGFHGARDVRREAGVHGPRVGEAHRKVAGEQAHLRALDPRKVRDGFLDARDATGAVHPDDPGLEPAVAHGFPFRSAWLCSGVHGVARSIGTRAGGGSSGRYPGPAAVAPVDNGEVRSISGVSDSELRSITVRVRSISGVSDFRAPVDNGEVRSILKVGRIVRAHGGARRARRASSPGGGAPRVPV